MPFDTTPHVITALLALGMALAFILADRNSPTSRALALFLVSIGLSIAVTVLVEGPWARRQGIPAWGGLFALPETLAFFFAYEWLLRVRRTVPARNLKTAGPDRLVRIAQILAGLYWMIALAFPEHRHEHFIGDLYAARAGTSRLWFWLFAAPLLVSLALGSFSGLLLLNRRPDRAESLRMLAFLGAAPFMASGLVLPAQQAPLGTAIGLLIFLVGAVQYHVTQGRRAQFLSRFLAPQVAEMVRERGLKSATDERTLELSVVYCDLRGFTAFSEATSSKKVIRILREYYDAVGTAAAASGGTIKDQAGDGVLILVGAPIPFEDHAGRALELAKRIRDLGIALSDRWSDAELHLGVGVGVASGYVTAGVIGAASRLEYTAVGAAVNLAARLCSEAEHGEVLLDQRTIELVAAQSWRDAVRPGEALKLKGFQQPVQSYVLTPA
ncbi:MAG: adenylate/guanylate cyclase domain-containing protein [Betaproteobacteria bacterium]|nr:MAG: adenylate/guanylate cyclase domain-containing protein [Betaproteobacteria bacterium]